jgi:hypothetical protein
MKVIATITLWIAAQILCLAQQKVPIAVSISTPVPVVQSGNEIRINVSVRNLSDEPISLLKALGPDGQAEAVNHLEVFGADGKRLYRIDGPSHRSKDGVVSHLVKGGISRTSVSVAPGETSVDFLVLSNLFDLSKPGIYTVVARHELMRLEAPKPEDRVSFVSSNRLVITVTN